MLFILSGPSCVGKSFSVAYFIQHYEFYTCIPFTSRPPRRAESEGVHHHYRSINELKTLSANFTQGYWALPFGVHYYGYSPQIDEVASNSHNYIIQAYSDIALKIKSNNRDSVTTIFLDFETDDAFLSRLEERFSDESEITHRMDHATHERACSNQFDHIVTDDNIYNIVKKIKVIIERVCGPVAGTSSNAPGPLCDVDLVHNIQSKSGIRVEGPALGAEGTVTAIGGCTVDITLSPRHYIQDPKALRKEGGVLDLADCDDKLISKVFMEQVIGGSEAILLRPGDFVLCQSNESVTIPPNMLGMLTGRSSYSRIGVSVELSQNILQPGHSGPIVLQVKNNAAFPIKIYPRTRIAQVVFFRLTGYSTKPYGRGQSSKYHIHNENIRSRIFMEEEFGLAKSDKQKRAFLFGSNLDKFLDLFQISMAISSFLLAILTLLYSLESRSIDVVLVLLLVFVSLYIAGVFLKHKFFRR